MNESNFGVPLTGYIHITSPSFVILLFCYFILLISSSSHHSLPPPHLTREIGPVYYGPKSFVFHAINRNHTGEDTHEMPLSLGSWQGPAGAGDLDLSAAMLQPKMLRRGLSVRLCVSLCSKRAVISFGRSSWPRLSARSSRQSRRRRPADYAGRSNWRPRRMIRAAPPLPLWELTWIIALVGTSNILIQYLEASATHYRTPWH
ncbi:hypothetical protein V8C37DRAFT_1780 [Trichoderma ceciliae]